MDQVEYYNQELEDDKKKLKETIIRLNRLKGKDKEEAIASAENLLKTARRNYKRFSQGINSLPSGSREKYEQIKSKHISEIKKLKSNLDMCKSQAERDSLLGTTDIMGEETKERRKDRKTAEPRTKFINRDGKKKIKDEELERELFKDVFETYEESIEIIDRLIHTADETEKTAAASMEMLAKQKEQLKSIDKELDEMNSAMKVAQKELASFMRRVMRSKIILMSTAIIFGLILLCVVAGVVYLILVSLGILPPPSFYLPGVEPPQRETPSQIFNMLEPSILNR